MATLEVTLYGANGLKELNMIEEQNPYVVIISDSDKKRSNVHINGGVNPGSIL